MKHTEQLWRRQGMPMGWRTDGTGQWFRAVELSVLLSWWWWRRMRKNPVHFYKVRRDMIARGETPIPERFVAATSKRARNFSLP